MLGEFQSDVPNVFVHNPPEFPAIGAILHYDLLNTSD